MSKDKTKKPKTRESRPGACADLKADRNKVLSLAAKKMEKGWAVGMLHDVTDEGHAYCAIGAIRSVKGFTKAAKQAAVFALRDQLGTDPEGESHSWDGFRGADAIEAFNDSQRDRQPVLDLFRAARKRRLRTRPVNDNQKEP